MSVLLSKRKAKDAGHVPTLLEENHHFSPNPNIAWCTCVTTCAIRW